MKYEFNTWRNSLAKGFQSDTGNIYSIKPIDDTGLSTHVKCLITDEQTKTQYMSNGYIQIGNDIIETRWSLPNPHSYKNITVIIRSIDEGTNVKIL